MCEEKLGPWEKIASALKADLVSFEVDGLHLLGEQDQHLLVHLPVSYPGGAGVVVSVKEYAAGYYVSDMGYGAREARNISSERAYEKAAADIAEQAGVLFRYTMFRQRVCYIGASADQLAGVIQTVAEVSVSACREVFAGFTQDNAT